MTDFSAIIRIHRARYPLMRPQDYGKLAYQSEFGPGHMIANERDAEIRLLEEWQGVSDAAVPCNPETIDNGLCRFHLTDALFSPENANALARLFVRSAREHAGTREGLEARLVTLARLDVEGMKAWLETYRRQGLPARTPQRSVPQGVPPALPRIARSAFGGFP
ncbi:MAG: hypothetical protein JW811_08540 [Clostridiales bacterium]|nr:hypothetical protein [Clostridiales bacterium]